MLGELEDDVESNMGKDVKRLRNIRHKERQERKSTSKI